MSKSIDERVVSMQFDNKHFENNVKTSMSTLDKLKQSLKFEGAAKGFDNISSSAKKVDVSPLAKGLESVKVKFSALEVMAVTALSNITNSAVNAGKKLVAAFTIDPIKSGLQEYETKINAVQTILANTSSKGTTLEEVTAVLDELNTYADKTIYNFAEMTKNIGTFTASGLDLEPAAKAIQGIANVAAVSGSTSQQASTAMYQLSQALSSGAVQLMDWNSVVHAGMGGKVFQDAIMRTAESFGMVSDNVLEAYENGVNFRELLNPKDYGRWFTSDLLSKTLQGFTKTGVVEYVVELTGATKESVSELQKLGDTSGYNTEEFNKFALSLANGDENLTKVIVDSMHMADTAEKAATEIKTFTQLMGALKEAAQSGWAQTWELIIGDFEEAKAFWSEIYNKFSGMLGKSAESRNTIIDMALGSKWDKLVKQVNDAGIATEDFSEKLKETATEHGIAIDDLIEKEGSLANVIKSGKLSSSIIIETIKKFVGVGAQASKTTVDMTSQLNKFQTVVDQVWRGDFSVGEERIKALTEAGWDYATVQGLVNKTVDGHRLTLEDLGDTITTLSDTQLENLGYTEEQIKAIRELAEQAEKTGTPLNELIKDLEKPSGRQLLLDSIRNALEGLTTVMAQFKLAWNEIFNPGMSEDDILEKRADRIYKIAEAIHKFSEYLNINKERADEVKRVLKGLFAVLDIVKTILTGGLNIAIKAVCKALGLMDVDILSVAASASDAIVKFRDWLFENNILAKGLTKFVEVVKKVYVAVRDWLKAFLEIPVVKNTISNITNFITGKFAEIKSFFSDKEGFTNFIANVKKTFSGSTFGNYISGGLTKLKEFFGRVKELDSISLSNVSSIFKDFSDNVVKYSTNIDLSFGGLKDKLFEKVTPIGDIFVKTKDKVKEFADYIREKIPAAVSIGMGVLTIASIAKLGEAIETIASPLNGISDILSTVAKGLQNIGKSITKYLKAKSFESVTVGIRNLAISILIIAGALAILTLLDQKKLQAAAISLGIIVVALTAFAFAISLIEKFGDSEKASKVILSMAASILLMALAVKLIGDLDPATLLVGLVVVGLLETFVLSLVAISTLAGEHADKAGTMMMKISAALIIMGVAIKIIGGMDPAELVIGLIVIKLLESFVIKLIIVSKLAGEHADKAGAMMLKIGAALILMAAAIKIIGGMNPDDLVKGLVVIGLLELLIIGLIAISALSGKYTNKIGPMMLGVGTALLLMSGAMKIIAGMTPEEIDKSVKVIGKLELFMAGLIAVSALSGENAGKAGLMLLAMAGTLLILTGVIYLIKDIEQVELDKAINAISQLMVMFGIIIAATGLSEKCTATLIIITVAIGLMAGVLYLLSEIDQSALENASKSLSMVMTAFALMIAATKLVDGEDWGKKIITIIAMTAAVAAIAAVLVIMAKLECDASINNALALSILLVAMTAALLLLSKISISTSNAIKGILALTAMAIPLLALVGILALMQFVDKAIESATALAGLATVLTLLLIPLMAVGVLIGVTGGVAALGLVALLAMARPLLALVGILALMQLIQNAEENTKLLIGLMTTMTEMLVKLSIVGPLAVIGVTAMSGLTLLMGGIAIFAIAVGALMEKFPQLEEFLDKGIPILEKLAFAIGSMLGNFVAGFTEAVMTVIPKLGTCLSEFMANVQPFIDGAKKIDESVLIGVGYLSAAILALTVADLIAGITSFLGVGFIALGYHLSGFMEAAQGFIEGASKITPETANSVRALSTMILTLTAAELIQGITSFLSKITGTSSMDSFATSLESFGEGIKAFSDSISDLSEDDLDKVDIAAKAGERMSTMISTLPASGGWLQTILGDKDLTRFGTSLPLFGAALVAYAESIINLTEEDINRINKSASAGQAMSDLLNSLPASGGWLQTLIGDKDLATFGLSLPLFGACLLAYALTVRGLTEEDSENMAISAKAASALSDLLNSLPASGGWMQKILGDKDLATFGTSLVTFGKGLKAYILSIAGINDESVTSVIKSGEVVEALVDVLDKVPTSGSWWGAIFGEKDGQGFGEAIYSLGIGLKKYVTAVKGIDDDTLTYISNSGTAIEYIANAAKKVPTDNSTYANSSDFMSKMYNLVTNVLSYINKASNITYSGLVAIKNSRTAIASIVEASSELSNLSGLTISSASRNISHLTNVITNLASSDFTGVDKFKKALDKLSTTDIDAFAKAFADASPKVSAAVTKMLDVITTIVTSKTGPIRDTFRTLITECLRMILNNTESFRIAGLKIVSALVASLSSVGTALRTIFSNALSSCATNIRNYHNSFYNAGAHVARGFAKGIEENADIAKRKAANMAKAAAKAAKEALKIQSPSKVFYKIGANGGKGLVNALVDYTDKSYEAGYEVAKAASKGLGNAMNRVTDAINSDVDIQPTITPVIDMNKLNRSRIHLTSSLEATMIKPVSSLSKVVSDAQDEINASNNKVINAINNLREDLNLYLSGDDKEIALYVDSKKLATSLAKPMDRQLNILSKKGAY